MKAMLYGAPVATPALVGDDDLDEEDDKEWEELLHAPAITVNATTATATFAPRR